MAIGRNGVDGKVEVTVVARGWSVLARATPGSDDLQIPHHT
jgi:hypothetical protein